MNSEILVASDVAQILKIDKQRVYDLVRKDQLPFIRLGERQYRFSKQAIENFLNNGGTQKEGDSDVDN